MLFNQLWLLPVLLTKRYFIHTINFRSYCAKKYRYNLHLNCNNLTVTLLYYYIYNTNSLEENFEVIKKFKQVQVISKSLYKQ